MEKNKIFIDENQLQQFFYYGIENKVELEEGLLFYVTSKIHNETELYLKDEFKFEDERLDVSIINNMSDEEKRDYYRQYREREKEQLEKMKLRHREKLVEEAIGIYEQYYKFIVLPDNKENYDINLSEDEIEKIRSKIVEKINNFEQEGILNVSPAGIYFSVEKENLYTERWVKLDKNSQKMTHYKNWTKIIYEILTKLEELEKQDIKEYQEKWIQVRLERALNRNPQDEVEVKNIETLKQIFNKKKEKYEGKKNIDDIRER